jgi:hypothetical protein
MMQRWVKVMKSPLVQHFGDPRNTSAEELPMATTTLCAVCGRVHAVSGAIPVVGLRMLFLPDGWKYLLVNQRDRVTDVVVCSAKCLARSLLVCAHEIEDAREVMVET